MKKYILISGIQPTGRLHIGNYLGALKNFVDLQNSGKYQCYFFIADMHALTENPEAKNLSANIISLVADFLAAGLSPKKSTIFQQSRIEPLQELKWIFSTLTPVSELMRMTTFKEKVLQPLKPSVREKITKERFEEIVEESNFGLAEYPVLMAADILIYDGKFVPVGDDQLQHLEFARTLARKFNNRFGKTFIEPQPILTKTARVMSLADPRKKMSKSEPAGCLFIDDSAEKIRKKISRATTDSGSEIKYDPEKKAGISNLLGIYSALSGKSIEKIEREFKGKGYAEFKSGLANLVANYFSNFRKSKKSLLAKPHTPLAALKAGSAKANKIANKKIAEVKKKIGIVIQ